MSDLKQRYEEIIDSKATAADKERELAEYKKLLVEQYGFEKDAVEQINLERQTGIDLINQETEAILRRTISENGNAFQRSREVMEAPQRVTVATDAFGISGVLPQLQAVGMQLIDLGNDTDGLAFSTNNLEDAYQILADAIDILQKKQLSRLGLTEDEERLLDTLNDKYWELGETISEWAEIYHGQIELTARYNLLMEGVSGKVIESKDAFDGLKRTLYETYGADKEVWEVMNSLINEMFPLLSQSVEETTEAVGEETQSFFANQAALDADADSTKRLAAAKADAEAAVRNLIPALFDEEGKLTDAGKAALEASNYLADLVQAEINLQNETARANYANIRAQLAALSTDAVKAAMAIIAAYNAAQAARDMGHSVGNLGYDREHMPAGTGNAVNLLRQLEALEATINSTTIQATAVGHYTSGSSSSGGSSGGRTGGSSGGRTGGSSSSSKTEDPKLTALKDRVSLLKSELSLLQAKGASEEEQIAKMKEIQKALHNQADYMRSIKASQKDINDISTEWWNYHNQISDLMAKEAESAEREADALERARKAQQDLINALRNRNVHFYNAASGQWEWSANPSSVASAREAYTSAMADLPAAAREALAYSGGKWLSTQLTHPNSGATNNFGSTFNIAGINISEADARAMSVYDLLQLSKKLSIYGNAG